MRKVGNIDYRGKARLQFQTINKDPSQTIQSDAHLTDIGNILKSFGAQGMEMLDETALIYADVSEFTDLRDALDQAKEAEVEFLKLPSKVREIFAHDVAIWLDTAHDEDKRNALVQAGFLKASVAKAEVVVEPGPKAPARPPPSVEEEMKVD